MATRSMKNALAATMNAEKDAFKDRLAKAEKLFADEPTAQAPVSKEADVVPQPPVSKVVREAFTIPEEEHKQIATIRMRLLQNATAANKSEVLRAGLLLLSELDDQELIQLFDRLEKVKTGRPVLTD